MYKPASVIIALAESGSNIVIESSCPASVAINIANIIVRTKAELTISTQHLPANTIQKIATITKNQVTFIC